MARKVLAKYTDEEKKLLPSIAKLLADGANLPYEENLDENTREELLSHYITTMT